MECAGLLGTESLHCDFSSRTVAELTEKYLSLGNCLEDSCSICMEAVTLQILLKPLVLLAQIDSSAIG